MTGVSDMLQLVGVWYLVLCPLSFILGQVKVEEQSTKYQTRQAKAYRTQQSAIK